LAPCCLIPAPFSSGHVCAENSTFSIVVLLPAITQIALPSLLSPAAAM
jgi:hypothetical protein